MLLSPRFQGEGMTLPDWSSGIASQMSAFLTWAPVANNIQLIVGTAVAVVMISLFLSVFLRH